MTDWHRLITEHPRVHDERYWPAEVALAVAIVLQVRLPPALSLGPEWILPTIETALLLLLSGGRHLSPRRREPGTMRAVHLLTLAAIAAVSLDNLTGLALLVRDLLDGTHADGHTLVLSALSIWVTNVIVFSLWFWELDGGGPVPRRARPGAGRDFLFPQMTLPAPDGSPDEGHGGETPPRPGPWLPDFVDYLYLAFTNATAFSPTDAMPLSHAAKGLMLVQASGALLTVLVVAARAVNILQA